MYTESFQGRRDHTRFQLRPKRIRRERKRKRVVYGVKYEYLEKLMKDMWERSANFHLLWNNVQINNEKAKGKQYPWHRVMTWHITHYGPTTKHTEGAQLMSVKLINLQINFFRYSLEEWHIGNYALRNWKKAMNSEDLLHGTMPGRERGRSVTDRTGTRQK